MRKVWAVILAIALALSGAGLACHALCREKETEALPLSSASLGLLLLEKDGSLLVLAVNEGSPAEKAGFLPGDYLIQLEATPLRSVAHLDELLYASAADQPVLMEILREKKTKILPIPFP